MQFDLTFTQSKGYSGLVRKRNFIESRRLVSEMKRDLLNSRSVYAI